MHVRILVNMHVDIRLNIKKHISSELAAGAPSDAGSNSSELLMCGGGVCSIFVLPLVARCLCIWRMFVFMSVVVTVWWSVGMFVV